MAALPNLLRIVTGALQYKMRATFEIKQNNLYKINYSILRLEVPTRFNNQF